MTAPAARPPAGAYEGAGRQVAVAVRGFSSVIVTSDDIVAAAHAAIGIALAESSHRLVMLADMANEVPPIQALVRGDDAHGIYDSFEFGTSFVRVAREVDGVSNFFVMPSGTESPVRESIISSPRWGTFASDFANSDELLLIVIRPDAPAIDKLAAQVDGVVLVGLNRLESAPQAHILAKIPHPTVAAPPRINLAPRREGWSNAKIGLAAGGLLAAGVIGGALLGRAGDDAPAESRASVVVSDSAAQDSAREATRATRAANPQDSAIAAMFAVEILAANTAEGANFEIERHGAQMPGATISLVPVGDTEATWYKVHAGAYRDSMEADRLLARLRRRRIVPDSAGTIVRAPLALLVDSLPAQAGMTTRLRERIEGLSTRGVRAYALLQQDGSARVYAGAFENGRQSTLAATALRVAGLEPVLTYRTGRLP